MKSGAGGQERPSLAPAARSTHDMLR